MVIKFFLEVLPQIQHSQHLFFVISYEKTVQRIKIPEMTL